MSAQTTMRDRLREATAAAHERLHRHPGLAAAARGDIAREHYRLLLARLYGFHYAFEAKLEPALRRHEAGIDVAARAELIAGDLLALGANRADITTLPLCGSIGGPANMAEALGALYVVEGSALGGAQIARALSPLFGSDNAGGRAFFLGLGARQAARWRALLARIESFSDHPLGADVVMGASMTFAQFENWMRGWSAGTTRRRRENNERQIARVG